MVRRQYVVQLTLFQRLLLRRREYSNAAVSTCSQEQVTIPFKNNGFITLDIYRPPSSTVPASHDHRVNESILLYLPRSSIFQPQSSEVSLNEDIDIASVLAYASSATVVQVNYRVSSKHRFPTAFHDVVVAYDWAVKHFSQKNTISSEDEELPHSAHPDHQHSSPEHTHKDQLQTRVGVCGELLGGTLALSLALSECRLPVPNGENGIEHPGRVIAAAVDSPIVDWILAPSKGTRASDSNSSRKTSRRKQPPTVKTDGSSSPSSSSTAPEAASATPMPTMPSLLAARKALFRPSRPADWFDPFASPLFFLRTPGVDVPSSKPAQSPISTPESAINLENDDTPLPNPAPSPKHTDASQSATDIRPHSYAPLAADDTVEAPLNSNPDSDLDPTSTPNSSALSSPIRLRPPRRSPLKYPPTALLPAAFPAVHISIAAGSGVHEQAGEMVALLRRALGRFVFPGTVGRGGVSDDVWGDGVGVAEGNEERDREKEERDAYVRERIALQVREEGGVGWDRDAAERVGRWFKGIFERKHSQN